MFTQIFDTHSHYTDSAFDADRHEVLSALPEAGIVHAVLAGTTLEDSTAGIALADRYDYIYAAVGIHPETAGQQPDGCRTLRHSVRGDSSADTASEPETPQFSIKHPGFVTGSAAGGFILLFHLPRHAQSIPQPFVLPRPAGGILLGRSVQHAGIDLLLRK